MRKYKDIYHKIYGVTFRIIFDNNTSYADDMIKKLIGKGKHYVYRDDDPLGFVTWVNDGSAIIYFNNKVKNDFNTISHEVFHAVYRMFKNKNILLCDESEEVFAYNIGWLVGEIDKYMRTFNVNPNR